MENSFLNLYTQIYKGSDRRQQNLPVEVDNRKSQQPYTPVLDSKIQKDFTGVKKDVFEAFRKTSALDKAVIKPQDNKMLREIIALIISPIPFARRLMPIEKSKEDDNSIYKTIGLGVVAAINVKEDTRDILTIAGRTKSYAPEGYYSKYGFFVGTSLED